MQQLIQQLQAYWKKSKDWWSTLAWREKQALAAGGVVVALFLVYEVIWSPIVDGAANMRKRIEVDQKNLAWMQAADKEINKLEGQSREKVKTVAPVALLALLQKKVAQAGLDEAAVQLKQASNDSIELHFQKVPFDSIMKLLLATAKDYNVTIIQMSAVAETTPGVVNADVVLRIG